MAVRWFVRVMDYELIVLGQGISFGSGVRWQVLLLMAGLVRTWEFVRGVNR